MCCKMELELIIEVISKSVLKLQFLKFFAAPKIIAFIVLINLQQVDLLCLSLKLFAEKKLLKNKLFFLLSWKHVKSISLFVVRINKKTVLDHLWSAKTTTLSNPYKKKEKNSLWKMFFLSSTPIKWQRYDGTQPFSTSFLVSTSLFLPWGWW